MKDAGTNNDKALLWVGTQMDARVGYGFIAVVFAGLLSFQGGGVSQASTATQSDLGAVAESCGNFGGVNFDSHGRRISDLNLVYPTAQIGFLGEGWVLLAYSITPTGTAANIRALDAIGDKSFVAEAVLKLGQARFEPAALGGQPIERHDERFDTQFKMDMNKAGEVHVSFLQAFGVSRRLREGGLNADAVRIVKPVTHFSLTLYEQATLAHGLALAYNAMKDYPRALIQVHHAVIGGEKLLVYGSRAFALALDAELEARNGNPGAAVCAFDTLKLKYKDYEPKPELIALIDGARTALTNGAPVRTEVEIVESDRDDVLNLWTHSLIRSSFRFSGVQGAPPKYRLVCPLAISEGVVAEGAEQRLDPAKGRCSLEVWGDPGVKFILDEH
jgi:hypothetical protein